MASAVGTVGSGTIVPFFEAKDGVFLPSWSARSPWREGFQNGLAIGGLLSHALVEAVPLAEMNLARFTLDILRPAPMAPVKPEWRTVRTGRRQTVMQGALVIGDKEVVRASALLVRKSDDGAPASEFAAPVPQPEDAPRETMLPLEMGLESRVVQRGVAGSDRPMGRVWVRPLTSVVAGSHRNHLIGAIMAADFSGSVSHGIDRDAWNSPNIDIAVHFIRQPRDEWILVEGETLLPGNGAALVEGRLSDRFGLFAHAHLTLVASPAVPAERPAWP